MNSIKNLLGGLQDFDTQDEFRNAEYYKLISDLLDNIHAKIPHEKNMAEKVAALTDIREEIFAGVNYKRAVIFLLSNGCDWALRNGHGCTMCGHLARQLKRPEMIPADVYLHQFQEEFNQVDFKKYPLLNLYNNGSFFNDNEIPYAARTGILKMIAANKDIKMLVLETRPEFVTEKKIKELKEFIPDKHVEIAMGLEMKNDSYRTICINKGFSLQQFERASQIILKYCKLRTYVLLKPPFLTERESIEHAVETIEYALELGASTVSLEACTIQDFTLVNYLYELGLYTPPWLWSIIDVVQRIKTPWKLIIGLFQFYPSPSKTPFNCKKCSDGVLEAICNYNRTLDRSLFDNLACECKKQWETIMAEESPSFKERLESAVKELKKML